MESLHGATVLRARYVLLLAIPASCLLWLLFFLQSEPSEIALRRDGFVPSVQAPEKLVVYNRTPPDDQESMEPPPPPPPPPPEDQAGSETPPPPDHRVRTETPPPPVRDRCSGRYIYIHDLPSRFNADLLRDCRSLSGWSDMCRFVANGGMGPRLTRTGGVLPTTGWYDTNQFTVEVIFHNRMKQYDCLTGDSSRADAVYVPYYAGLDVGRYLWGFSNNVRDSLSIDLSRWLRSLPEWAAHGGRDHFLIVGRISWDFRREDEEGQQWGNKLLLLPEVANMTALVIEASPWHGAEVGLPYPTYFHPNRESEMVWWQRKMRVERRPWLFSFAGARRQNGSNGSVRDRIIDECARSPRCGLLQCGPGKRNDCYAPGNVMRLFKASTFCLQPQGDSYTRRSTFDSMLAGCVPVFFHPGSAYVQYRWHLPTEYTKYSVFIEEESVRNGTVRIEDVLRRFSAGKVRGMREEVIKMMPGLIYKDPRVSVHGVRDAVDVAVDNAIERVRTIKEGLSPVDGLSGAVVDNGEHDWHRFFER